MKIVIVIPVYNEGLILKKNILKLFNFCQENINSEYQIIIADNNSNDETPQIAKNLAADNPHISYLFIGQKGKGIAIKTAWQKNLADVYCFMDADLATNLEALPQLISGISQGYDVVIGSRFHPESKINRPLSRKLISQGYRLILKIFLGLKIKDVPCGFKAISHKIKEEILPQINNQEWFFDSELVILAEKQGYKIKEIPIRWSELRSTENKSRVKIIPLSLTYLKKVIALRKRVAKL